MAHDFKWQTDIIHHGVISQTLEEIADRLAVSQNNMECPFCYDILPSHKSNCRSQEEAVAAMITLRQMIWSLAYSVGFRANKDGIWKWADAEKAIFGSLRRSGAQITGENMSNMQALNDNHPFMVAWKKFVATTEYANAVQWAMKEVYDDGRLISDANRKNHVEGALWLAFTKGIEMAAEVGREP